MHLLITNKTNTLYTNLGPWRLNLALANLLSDVTT